MKKRLQRFTRELILMALVTLFSCSCGTKYKEYGDAGNLKYSFSTYGDFGIMTDNIDESKTNTGGIPLLGGEMINDNLGDQEETTQETKIKVGSLEISGTMVHSTSIDRAGHWVYRTTKVIATAATFIKGLSVWGASDIAKTKGKTDIAGVEGNTANVASDNATKLGTAKIDSETALGLEALQ